MANPVNGGSTDKKVAAVKGENTVGGDGVTGVSNSGNAIHGISVTSFGVLGESTSGRGVVALSDTDYGLRAASRTSAGIRGSSVEGRGVEGWATNSEGVVGISAHGTGVWGQTEGAGIGTAGSSKTGPGVRGTSLDGRGVDGESTNAYGVAGVSQKSAGVRGTSTDGRGVEGWSTNTEGVVGISTKSTGVWGQTDGDGRGVAGTSKHGIGVYGFGGHLAAFFEGDVEVTGDIRLTNADCAEDFDIAEADLIEAGTVVVLGDEGTMSPSRRPYDKRVAGVISGAGSYRPGIVLDKQQSSNNRMPVALLGKVFCRVDATHGAIEVGDLLTTSPTLGHAMRASDPLKAFGAVIGKALRPLKEGQSLIPILIALQ